ncbi:MAG TPA: radical SAM protein [bacterium]|nr:radical SAM protein [bacterium]HEX67910.1 radical SAM protein [bacterium]
MKILLVNLPWKVGDRWGVRAGSRWPHLKDPNTEGDYQPYPFYLGYATALLRREGFSAYLWDCLAEKIDKEEFYLRVQEFSPDFIFAEVATVSLDNDLEILSQFRDIPVAVGGADLNIRKPEFLKKYPFIDFVLVGEYEVTLLELVSNLEKGRGGEGVKGVIYRDRGEVIINPPRPLLKDLDWLPWPLREELPMEKYVDAPGGLPLPCCQMWTSRGCPFQCIFCAWPQLMYGGNRFRARDPVKVVDEMEYVLTKLGFKSIYIDDDTTNVGKSRMKKLAEEILRRGLKFPWAIMARPDLMDEEVLEKLREAGLHSVKYVVESASQEILDRAKKRMNLEKAIRMIKFTQELGIKTHLTFTFGLPGETKETIKRTIELALSLNPTSVQFSIATPFPGTEFYEMMEKEGYIVCQDFSKYDGNYASVIRTEHLTPQDLEEARRMAYELWGENLKKRERFRIPLEKRYFRTFIFYLKHYGWKGAFRKTAKFLKFILQHNLKCIKDKFYSLHNPPLHFAWDRGSGRIYWRGKEFTFTPGVNLAFRVKDSWRDISLSNFKVKKGWRKLRIISKWNNLPITFSLSVLPYPEGFRFVITLKTFRRVRIQELKFLIYLSPRYQYWFTDMERGKFPHPSGFHPLPLSHPWVDWVGVRECGEGADLLPALTLQKLSQGEIELEDTPPHMGARVLGVKLWEVVISPKEKKVWEILLRAGEEEKLVRPSEEKKRSLLKFVKNAWRLEGLKGVLKRSLRHLTPSFYLEKFPHLVGVMDGKRAYTGPYFVQIDVTNSCNNNCIGCWCNSPLLGDKKMPPRVKREFLPFSVLKELIEELRDMGCKEIYYSGGGEPFTHPEIMEILRFTKQQGMVCYVNTNFTLLDKKKIDELIDMGVDHLTISIWAGTARTYAITHPNKTELDFERIKENLIYLNTHKRGKPLVKLYNVIFNLNYRELEEMIEFARTTHSESVEFTVIDTIPGATDKLLLNASQQEELLRLCEKIKRRREEGWAREVVLFNFDQFYNRIANKENVTSGLYDRWIIGKIPCYIGWVFTRILPDGNVNGCLKAHRIPLGNIFQNKFSEIWNSPSYQEFRYKALTFDKNDPFFSMIGNDPNCKVGCYKSCDDLQRNLKVHEELLSLSPLERKLMRIYLPKYRRIKEEKREKFEDPLLAGIMHGRKAFTGPEQVVVDLTNSCNLRCIACWTHSPLLKNPPPPSYFKEKLPVDTVKRMLDEMKELNVKRVRFTGGGEPLVYKGIDEIMLKVKENSMVLCLTTNLYRIEERIREIIRDKVDELAVSLWSAHPETYVELHPGTKEEDFLEILENLKFICKGKGRVTIANVIMKKNFREIVDMVKLGKEVGADAIYFTMMDPQPGTESLLLDEKELEELNELLIEVEKEAGEEIELENWEGFKERVCNPTALKGLYDKGRVDRIPCYVGWIFARIMADGSVVPCCRAVKKVMGNVKEKSFQEIWFSPQYNEFRGRAKFLPKYHPYFDDIGCYFTCDNLMHNEEIHRRYFSHG